MAKQPESQPNAANSRPARAGILLVEEAPASLVDMRTILQGSDYDLVEVHTPAEALARLKTQEFAVVVIDVRMPELKGFDTARLIRDDELSRSTPILFSTADDIDQPQVERGYALGAADFFLKPLSPVVVQAKVRGFVALFQQKERARQEAEQLRLIVQGTTDYAIFMLDPQGRVATWNRGAERIKQYAAEEIIGQHFSRFYPQDVIDQGWPEHELRVATVEGRFEDEGWRLRKDGSRFWANVVITALRDEWGDLRGFSKVTRDLTERKEAEESLRRSEERFRHMVEGVKDYAIFMLDPSGRVASWNQGAERIKGYAADEIIGKHFSTFYPQEALDRGWPEHELKIAAAEGRFEDEGWRVRKDGSRFWANVVITAIKDDRNQLLGFTKVTRDLTARKEAEENARRLAEETAARQVAHGERERLRVTLASIGDAVISTDAQGRVDFLNSIAEELVGWNSGEVAGQSLEDVFRIVNETSRRPVENPALRALREGRVVGLANHTILISRDGTERPIDDSAAPIRDAAGNLIGSVLVFRDISERRRREWELRQREEYLRTVVETTPACIKVVAADGTLVSMNTPGLRMIDAERLEDVQGKSVYSLVSPEYREVFRQFNERICRGESGILEFEIEGLKGTRRHMESHAAPLRGPDGSLQQLAITYDVTDRKRVDAILRESEEKLRLLANTIPQLAWMARPDGYIFWYNRRWFDYTGTTPEQMEGWGWQTVHDPETLPHVMEQWKRSLSNGEPFDMVFPLRGSDGVFRPFLTRVNPFKDAQGRILYWFGTNTDISEFKRMEAALRDADRRKDEFLATLAHELRNPLAPIRNALQILKMPRVEAELIEQTRDMMERQVHHLVRLVDDLLDVSRVMRGKIELRREPVELAAIIARAVETAKPLIEVQEHNLDISVPKESLLLDADPVRLTQVVGNLLMNAAKYSDSRGQIGLTVKRDADQAILTIRDNGIGIPPDMLSHIFELFVQADHASSKAQGGLGIGLTLVKNLVRMHGGSVTAFSDGLGKGSEFIVRLPLLSRQPAIAEAKTAPAPISPISGHRLLVVDDNRDAAISLSMLLRLQGHEVRVAHDGPTALEVATTFQPSVIFLDIGMPGMDGYEVARRVRKTPGIEKTVLAALTGWGQQEDRLRTADAGFNHHLVKPPDPKLIEKLLNDLKSRKPTNG
ncbi:MAG: PAS domain S-box protein [Planctomycetaceae bacterium]|nr:PAS domain S-box protein [Planctomycetaceae bacterium]